jgi:hypothetical protein
MNAILHDSCEFDGEDVAKVLSARGFRCNSNRSGVGALFRRADVS